jgi:hypothetical protein
MVESSQIQQENGPDIIPTILNQIHTLLNQSQSFMSQSKQKLAEGSKGLDFKTELLLFVNLHRDIYAQLSQWVQSNFAQLI